MADRQFFANKGSFAGKTVSEKELYDAAVRANPQYAGKPMSQVVDQLVADHPGALTAVAEPPRSTLSAADTATGIRGVEKPNAVSEMASNLLPSFGRQVLNRITGPIDTAVALGGAAKELLFDTPAAEMPAKLVSQVAHTGRGIVDYAKSRYGSAEQIEDILRNDPMGVVGDVAALVSGAGALTKTGGKVASIASKVSPKALPIVGRTANALSNTGAKMSSAGDWMDPAVAPALAATWATRPWRERVGKQSYDAIIGAGRGSSSLKDFERAADEAWSRRIPVGREGVEQIYALNKVRDAAVKSAVERATRDGVEISTREVVEDALIPQWDKVDGPEMAQKKAAIWDAAGDRKRGFLPQEGNPITPFYLVDEASKGKIGPFMDKETAELYASNKGVKGEVKSAPPMPHLDEKVPRRLRADASEGHMLSDGVFDQGKKITFLDEDGVPHEMVYGSSPMTADAANRYRMGVNRDTDIQRAYLRASKGATGDVGVEASRAIGDQVRTKLYEAIKDYDPPKEGWAESGRIEKRLIDAKTMIENAMLESKTRSPLGGSGPYVWASGAMTLSSLLTGQIPAILPAMVTAIGTIKSIYGHDPGAASKMLFKLVQKYPDPNLWSQLANVAARPVSMQDGDHMSDFYRPSAASPEPPMPTTQKDPDDIGESPFK